MGTHTRGLTKATNLCFWDPDRLSSTLGCVAQFHPVLLVPMSCANGTGADARKRKLEELEKRMDVRAARIDNLERFELEAKFVRVEHSIWLLCFNWRLKGSPKANSGKGQGKRWLGKYGRLWNGMNRKRPCKPKVMSYPTTNKGGPIGRNGMRSYAVWELKPLWIGSSKGTMRTVSDCSKGNPSGLGTRKTLTAALSMCLVSWPQTIILRSSKIQVYQDRGPKQRNRGKTIGQRQAEARGRTVAKAKVVMGVMGHATPPKFS